MTDRTSSSLTHCTKNESTQFGAIFAVSFIVFLAVALIAQLLTFQWRSWFPGAESEKSIIDSVKASVYTFMSYLT